ncbi:MAG: GntR family transcriptional regulator [Gemmatimonadetes bacterium]|nr:GntR family transcriptional regulator [Gemmatimonadota bacterium]
MHLAISVFDRIDPRSPTPLYEQIAGRIRVAIAAGELEGGHHLSSVRQLASTLRVNPATVVQAYRELEREGFVELRHGAGTFVRGVSEERKKSERVRGAAQLVRGLLAEAARLGVNGEDLRTALDHELGRKVP